MLSSHGLVCDSYPAISIQNISRTETTVVGRGSAMHTSWQHSGNDASQINDQNNQIITIRHEAIRMIFLNLSSDFGCLRAIQTMTDIIMKCWSSNPLLLSGKAASSRKWKWQHCNSLRMWSVEWSAFVDCKCIDTNTWQNDGTATSNREQQANKKTGADVVAHTTRRINFGGLCNSCSGRWHQCLAFYSQNSNAYSSFMFTRFWYLESTMPNKSEEIQNADYIVQSIKNFNQWF